MRNEVDLPRDFSKIAAPLSHPAQAKDNPGDLSSLAPSIGFVRVGEVGCGSLFFFYEDCCNWWGRGLGLADELLILHPPSQRMVCTHWKGEGCRRADGHPQLPVSAQMAAPTPISVLCSKYGGTSTCCWGSRPGEPGVYCPSSQGCPGEIFYPGQLK